MDFRISGVGGGVVKIFTGAFGEAFGGGATTSFSVVGCLDTIFDGLAVFFTSRLEVADSFAVFRDLVVFILGFSCFKTLGFFIFFRIFLDRERFLRNLVKGSSLIRDVLREVCSIGRLSIKRERGFFRGGSKILLSEPLGGILECETWLVPNASKTLKSTKTCPEFPKGLS
ncbi:MAG: hypothetical protein VX693_07275 [Pseudomonadota bacterium]|nr:hypothetical protein [Pseudomonadota bacterium]